MFHQKVPARKFAKCVSPAASAKTFALSCQRRQEAHRLEPSWHLKLSSADDRAQIQSRCIRQRTNPQGVSVLALLACKPSR